MNRKPRILKTVAKPQEFKLQALTAEGCYSLPDQAFRASRLNLKVSMTQSLKLSLGTSSTRALYNTTL